MSLRNRKIKLPTVRVLPMAGFLLRQSEFDKRCFTSGVPKLVITIQVVEYAPAESPLEKHVRVLFIVGTNCQIVQVFYLIVSVLAS